MEVVESNNGNDAVVDNNNSNNTNGGENNGEKKSERKEIHVDGLPAHYKAYMSSKKNKIFYFNTKTRETTWDFPKEAEKPKEDVEEMNNDNDNAGKENDYTLESDKERNNDGDDIMASSSSSSSKANLSEEDSVL